LGIKYEVYKDQKKKISDYYGFLTKLAIFCPSAFCEALYFSKLNALIKTEIYIYIYHVISITALAVLHIRFGWVNQA